MLIFVYRRPDRYPAYKMQLEEALSAREIELGLMISPEDPDSWPAPWPDLWNRLAGIRGTFDLLAEAPSAAELVAKVAELGLDSPPFLIETSQLGRNKARISSKHLCGKLAMVIEGDIAFYEPTTRYRVFETQTRYYFARQCHSPSSSPSTLASYANRPVRTSSALPPELAVAAIHAVARPGDRLVDPTCGSGTILHEASVRGLTAWGYDVSWRCVRGARTNLAHFGVEAAPGVERLVFRADARSVDFESDVVVANLPYGRAIRTSADVIVDILTNLKGRAKRYAFFTGQPLANTLDSVGYRHIREVDLSKPSGARRFMSIARSR